MSLATPAAQPAEALAAGSLAALLTSAAFAPLETLGWIRVTGSDRVRWLNGMVTNNIAALQPGQGCYNFFLNAQGRIQGDATAFLLEDSILLQTASGRIPALIALLDHFIIMDDVELTPLDNIAGILVAGPQSLSIVQALGTARGAAAPCSSDPSQTRHDSASQAPGLKQTVYAGASVHLICAHSPTVPRFEIWSDPSTITLIVDELKGTPAVPASETDLTHLRILEGTPLYGIDIRHSETAKDLPQETAQARALHFAKGCYLGQEIVERIRSRGAVHRTFSGFVLTGELPPAGTVLTQEDPPDKPGKPVAELTSVARIHLPSGPVQLALGYIRREALEASQTRNLPLHYPGGSAIPAALPFAAQLASELQKSISE